MLFFLIKKKIVKLLKRLTMIVSFSSHLFFPFLYYLLCCDNGNIIIWNMYSLTQRILASGSIPKSLFVSLFDFEDTIL